MKRRDTKFQHSYYSNPGKGSCCSPAPFSSSHQRRLEFSRLNCGCHGVRPSGGGAVPSSMATVALVAQLDGIARRGVGVSSGKNGRRGYVFPTGDGCVELTGKRRCRNTASCRHCSRRKRKRMKDASMSLAG